MFTANFYQPGVEPRFPQTAYPGIALHISATLSPFGVRHLALVKARESTLVMCLGVVLLPRCNPRLSTSSPGSNTERIVAVPQQLAESSIKELLHLIRYTLCCNAFSQSCQFDHQLNGRCSTGFRPDDLGPRHNH